MKPSIQETLRDNSAFIGGHSANPFEDPWARMLHDAATRIDILERALRNIVEALNPEERGFASIGELAAWNFARDALEESS